EREGPYDMIMVVRKIRTGQINEKTIIVVGPNGKPMLAGAHDELKEFFEDEAETPVREAETHRQYKLGALLKHGLDMMINNHGTPLFTGILMLTAFLLIYLFSFIYIVGFILAWTIVYIFYTGF